MFFELSNELIILCRRYREYLDVNNFPQQMLSIGMMSAASYTDIKDWLEYVGNWINELSSLELTKDGALGLNYWVKNLALLEPRIRCYCGYGITVLEDMTENMN